MVNVSRHSVYHEPMELAQVLIIYLSKWRVSTFLFLCWASFESSQTIAQIFWVESNDHGYVSFYDPQIRTKFQPEYSLWLEYRDRNQRSLVQTHLLSGFWGCAFDSHILCFYKKHFSPSCNKVARRPVETVPWRVSLRQRAQFHKGASWDRFPHNIYNGLKIDVLTHSTI